MRNAKSIDAQLSLIAQTYFELSCVCIYLSFIKLMYLGIHVPNQKLHVDNTIISVNAAAESSALINARQQNLHDLFGQIKHYSANVRKGQLHIYHITHVHTLL
jgi:hypothetical protein